MLKGYLCATTITFDLKLHLIYLQGLFMWDVFLHNSWENLHGTKLVTAPSMGGVCNASPPSPTKHEQHHSFFFLHLSSFFFLLSVFASVRFLITHVDWVNLVLLISTLLYAAGLILTESPEGAQKHVNDLCAFVKKEFSQWTLVRSRLCYYEMRGRKHCLFVLRTNEWLCREVFIHSMTSLYVDVDLRYMKMEWEVVYGIGWKHSLARSKPMTWRCGW